MSENIWNYRPPPATARTRSDRIQGRSDGRQHRQGRQALQGRRRPVHRRRHRDVDLRQEVLLPAGTITSIDAEAKTISVARSRSRSSPLRSSTRTSTSATPSTTRSSAPTTAAVQAAASPRPPRPERKPRRRPRPVVGPGLRPAADARGLIASRPGPDHTSVRACHVWSGTKAMDTDRVAAVVVGSRVPGCEAIDGSESGRRTVGVVLLQRERRRYGQVGGVQAEARDQQAARTRAQQPTCRPPRLRSRGEQRQDVARGDHEVEVGVDAEQGGVELRGVGLEPGQLRRLLPATSSIDASRSNPTQSYPSSDSRIVTRPVPQPASSTRLPAGTASRAERAACAVHVTFRYGPAPRSGRCVLGSGRSTRSRSSCQRLM